MTIPKSVRSFIAIGPLPHPTRKSSFLVLAFLLAQMLPAPAATNRQSQDDTIKLSADLVLLDAQVLNKGNGHAVRGLTKDDFVLYEDNVKQHISYFSQDKLLLSIVILLDVSSSIAPVFNSLRSAATQSLARLKSGDQVALMAFGGSTKVAHDFTTDKSAIADAIQTTDGTGLENGTIINEGVSQATRYLQEHSSATSRRVILAITDDMSTQRSPSPSESDTLRKLHESNAVVCGLIFFNPLQHTRITQVPGSVRNYANQTGGVIINANKKRLATDLDELIERLRSRYSLGFFSTNETRDGRFRKIKLELAPQTLEREGKVEIITRKGYQRH
ncbi:MAG TPA: VWA domain-containing protein [Blastocatellia bacterium]|nr:VWA domain-containing protein [Blastocatellia bacterium]